MANLASLFTWGAPRITSTPDQLPEIFKMGLAENIFTETDLRTLYSRILTDIFERTQGLTEDQKVMLWDNCLGSESDDGLISLLTKAMFTESELFIVYVPAIKLIREATGDEKTKIRADYKANNESSTGVYISFKNFRVNQMLKFYSVLEYCTVSSLYKQMNLSKAVQIKISKLREAVGAIDAEVAIAQAVSMADALKAGKDLLMDAGDVLAVLSVDLTATNSSMEFLAQKRSFYLGLPASYLTGVGSKGLGDSGQGDARKVEAGLKPFFFSIAKPVCEALFKSNVTFESEDFGQLSSNLEALKTFEITSDEHLSAENKTKIINRLFDLPEGTKGDERDVTNTNPPPTTIPPKAT